MLKKEKKISSAQTDHPLRCFFPKMNPPLHASSIFFLLVLFFISTNIPTSVCDSSQYTNCSSPFSCGVVNNVSYPFWGGNRADYCGQPAFQLDCQDTDPKLIVNSVTYRILRFNLGEQNLTVARDDYWKTMCPSEYRNTSFDSATFNYVDMVLNISLLYDCIDSFKQGQFLISSSQCSSDSTNRNVYYGNASWIPSLEGVCTAVIIPIFETYVAGVFRGQMDILDAIDDGFGLRWVVNSNECDNCVNSGGQCGYNQNQNQFTCFCKDGGQGTSSCSGSESSSKLDGRILIIASASAGTVGLVIVLIVIICYRNRSFKLAQKIFKARGTFHDHHVETFTEIYGTWAPRKYTYSEVKRMTKSFTTKIGQGGYGTVYKATMPDGHLVAVKVLSETKGNGEEFINEVASISRTSHVNIVSLIGFCYEKNKRALIYEFMPNGSLDKFIYKEDPSNAICNLEWLRLYQIIIGIARGLEYLHQGCNTRILHLDIKPQNILLDEEFCPKISDFGLAKICRKKESIVSILDMRGTIGYIAPEVFSRTYGGVSYKSDVYSYGMLVLEMIGGRKNFDNGGSHTSEMYFPDWIYKELEQSNVLTKNMSTTEEENKVISKMTMVSLWCIQPNPADRPSMTRVVEMLEGPNESLPFPPKPSLYSPPRPPIHFSDVPSSTMLDSNSTPIQTE